MARLLTYRMTSDSGFAPNPFHGVLTLATCKYGIRKAKTRKVGDWIAGFSSLDLQHKAKVSGVCIDRDALIWIGKITEKPLPLGKYFEQERFNMKKPFEGNQISISGDNIYKYGNGSFGLVQSVGNLQKKNRHHPHKAEQDSDKAGENVLIFEKFYYFGDKSFIIPDDIKIKKPDGVAFYGHWADEKEADKLIKLLEKDYKEGKIGNPCMSWKKMGINPGGKDIGCGDGKARGQSCLAC